MQRFKQAMQLTGAEFSDALQYTAKVHGECGWGACMCVCACAARRVRWLPTQLAPFT